ncbi:UDP-4-amino-4,6-dideoxy-N-acetyl-beta-L-altrosamine transaminase [Iocasia frigidifontis]|uniref:UDP-4-amino-4, 6-dideoxy-N-acetyl-beta-L-altrosamine transaminase n=1 Tax=Iocasia fonsfrigidae TaxID=2682810 RepID=A0A8A7KBK9_9FIRM|nr:UDP-4-amino-4,6-dideoxy-N-acetyl-beta-L-altrosamine transaminase [Iocasia fonsfrigidae]QTL96948.1 UDP-4-amino-4,6-dideoxy-N-acetyl-beta-L-altrosamine transaminase [Iocasia fonsfrigidae]
MCNESIRNEFLPYGRQCLDKNDIKSVVDVLKGDWLTTGPKIKEFEEKVADYCNTEYAVAVSNGTAALHAACFAAGISNGDEVITTPLTFAASANCILYQRAKPIFVDIDPKTYNINPQKIREKITSKTKAIIPVDYTGRPVFIDEIMKIAREYNLLVIEDAAHSIGAKYKKKKVGSLADMTTFSFHPVKHITTGEGGMILTNDKESYNRLKKFRTHGIVKGKDVKNQEEGPWFYEQLELGYNYRMTDIQAALGISQLEKIDQFIDRRKAIVKRYNDAFHDFDLLEIPFQTKDIKSSWHLYVVKLNLEKLTVSRKEIFEVLRKEKLGVNVHYIPVYYHPYYQNLGYKKGICPVAEDLYERIITLPLFPQMKSQDVEDVIKIVYKVLNNYRKY